MIHTVYSTIFSVVILVWIKRKVVRKGRRQKEPGLFQGFPREPEIELH